MKTFSLISLKDILALNYADVSQSIEFLFYLLQRINYSQEATVLLMRKERMEIFVDLNSF